MSHHAIWTISNWKSPRSLSILFSSSTTILRLNIEKILNSFLNLLYPNVCCFCDKICDDYICPKCKIKLNKIAKFKTNKYNNKYFRKHIYLFKYDGIIKDTLIKYKFREKNYKYKGFVNFLLKNKKICEILKSYDIIIPVPIHRIRKLERGYNQSELLATEIAKSIDGLKCETKILIKKINITLKKKKKQFMPPQKTPPPPKKKKNTPPHPPQPPPPPPAPGGGARPPMGPARAGRIAGPCKNFNM